MFLHIVKFDMFLNVLNCHGKFAMFLTIYNFAMFFSILSCHGNFSDN